MCCECAGSSRLPDSRKDVPARQEALSPGIEKTDRPVPSFNSNSVTWPTGCLQALQAQLCFRFEPGSSGITRIQLSIQSSSEQVKEMQHENRVFNGKRI